MKYFLVDFNGKYRAKYKTIKACVNYIQRNGLKNDDSHYLAIVSSDYDVYDPMTGKRVRQAYIEL